MTEINPQLRILLKSLEAGQQDVDDLLVWLGKYSAAHLEAGSDLEKRIVGELEWTLNAIQSEQEAPSFLLEVAHEILEGLHLSAWVSVVIPSDSGVVDVPDGYEVRWESSADAVPPLRLTA